ncbi:hypothetical protein TSAR_007887 [Trichomalopsis sarcophagae]|uniref:PCNA-associated factor histone-like domain-containing protein n=1 Tax=Trichomalopsis sarcophagae TaxID=543379 RepID=A0A232F851_9HYME|nr:hypothetical protein TSAR_007887 [Trichomalopsis sarcophagae]
MVRTKADAAVRVAAGGKAPKKTANRAPQSPAPGSDKGGKDNLPGNRYCPRETPAWQKKITFFYNKNDDEMNESSSSQANDADEKQNGNGKEMKKNKPLDDSNEMDVKESDRSPSKTKVIETKDCYDDNETDEDECMETDE